MIWPFRKRHVIDPDNRRRVAELQERIEQQSFLSEQAAQEGRAIRERTGEISDKAAEIQRVNHVVEGVEATFVGPGLIDMIKRRIQNEH